MISQVSTQRKNSSVVVWMCSACLAILFLCAAVPEARAVQSGGYSATIQELEARRAELKDLLAAIQARIPPEGKILVVDFERFRSRVREYVIGGEGEEAVLALPYSFLDRSELQAYALADLIESPASRRSGAPLDQARESIRSTLHLHEIIKRRLLSMADALASESKEVEQLLERQRRGVAIERQPSTSTSQSAAGASSGELLFGSTADGLPTFTEWLANQSGAPGEAAPPRWQVIPPDNRLLREQAAVYLEQSGLIRVQNAVVTASGGWVELVSHINPYCTDFHRFEWSISVGGEREVRINAMSPGIRTEYTGDGGIHHPPPPEGPGHACSGSLGAQLTISGPGYRETITSHTSWMGNAIPASKQRIVLPPPLPNAQETIRVTIGVHAPGMPPEWVGTGIALPGGALELYVDYELVAR